MLFQCSRVLANFPTEKLRLVHRDQTRLVWDEHGGTFVLRLEGLEVLEAPDSQGEAEICLEAALPEADSSAREVESFAGKHGLRLGLAPDGPELSEKPILAACHIPAQNLFIFSEDSQLTLRLSSPQTLALHITGAFKSRRLPCQETDVVIHLDQAAISRLLAGLLAWTPKTP
jgi:hypothetical protein